MRQAIRILLPLSLSTAGCGGGEAPPPGQALELEPMVYGDITQHALYGSGCNFVPEGGGMAAYALALDQHGYIKRGGAIVTLAPDKTSAPLPRRSWSRYTGAGYVLTLARTGAKPPTVNGVIESFAVALTITDAQGKVLYTAPGSVQCKPM